MKKQKQLLFPTFFLVVAILACGIPGAANTPEQDGILLITQAAKTVQSQLTQAHKNTSATQTRQSRPPTVTHASSRVSPNNSAIPRTQTSPPCDQITYVSDLTIPDGTKVTAGQTFTKKWLLKNSGSCTWTTSYASVFSSGEKMGAPGEIFLTGNVAPGQTFELSINLTAPNSPGKYQGNWKMRNQNANIFGLPNGMAFYVLIEVISTSSTSTPDTGSGLIYDFSEHYCSANWSSENGDLICPGNRDDNAGFVLKLDNPVLESGAVAGGKSLETRPLSADNPNWNDNGSIQGIFPAITIKDGYHFKSQIGCLQNAETCNVNFLLGYSEDGNPLTSLGDWSETYDNSIRNLDINLSSLAGKKVKFYLSVDAASDDGDDEAVWIYPRIVK